LCWTCDVCDTHVELFDLINVIDVLKISHLDVVNYDYNATFDDLVILKLYIYIHKLNLKKKKVNYEYHVLISLII